MPSKKLPSLPADRAFVLQLHANAKGEPAQWHGRVEHVVSFRAAHFKSLDELLVFIGRVLNELQEKDSVDVECTTSEV